jgi:non-specific serine/threonine protein kinase
MLETLREFAAEQVPAAEQPGLSRQHYRHYLDFAETATPRLNGPDQVEWLRRLGREHENLRSALSWSLSGEAPGTDSGLRFATALWWFWLRRGHFREGRRWLETALEHAGQNAAPEDDAGGALRLKALQGLGSILYFHGEYAEAEQIFHESLVLAKGAGDPEPVAFSLFGVAICAMNQVATQGPDALRRSIQFGQESLQYAELSGSPLVIGRAFIPLAIAIFHTGDVETAEAQNTRCVALLRQAGEWWDLAIALVNQSVIRRHKGNAEGAHASLSEAIVLSREENPTGTVWGLWGMAGVTGALKQPERAARLFGAVSELSLSLHITVPEVWMEGLFKPDREAVRTALGQERFAALEAEGRAMSVAEAVAFALNG